MVLTKLSFRLEIIRSSDEKVISRYDKNVGRSWVYAMKNWTLCPEFEECKSVFQFDDGEKTTALSFVRIAVPKCLINHFPATCEDNQKWSMRSFGESNKPCPKYKSSTSKTEGCLHMICKVDGCKHEYCWLCLENWSDSHSYYKCASHENLGETNNNNGDFDHPKLHPPH